MRLRQTEQTQKLEMLFYVHNLKQLVVLRIHFITLHSEHKNGSKKC